MRLEDAPAGTIMWADWSLMSDDGDRIPPGMPMVLLDVKIILMTLSGNWQRSLGNPVRMHVVCQLGRRNVSLFSFEIVTHLSEELGSFSHRSVAGDFGMILCPVPPGSSEVA